jgi:hypothetical protein
VQQHDDVEVVLHGPPVARLLVASVPEIAGVANDLHREVALRLVLEPDVVGEVVARVVADKDLGDPGAEARREPVEDLGEGGRRVVGDDED